MDNNGDKNLAKLHREGGGLGIGKFRGCTYILVIQKLENEIQIQSSK